MAAKILQRVHDAYTEYARRYSKSPKYIMFNLSTYREFQKALSEQGHVEAVNGLPNTPQAVVIAEQFQMLLNAYGLPAAYRGSYRYSIILTTSKVGIASFTLSNLPVVAEAPWANQLRTLPVYMNKEIADATPRGSVS